MSTASHSSKVSLPAQPRDSRRVQVLYTTAAALWLPLVVWLALSHRQALVAVAPSMALWGLLFAVVNLLSLTGWQSAPFAPDDPIGAAIALIFDPVATAIIVLLGAIDPRELKGQISPMKSLWNRSQVSFGWFLGSSVAHAIVPTPSSTRLLVPLAFLVLVVTDTSNYLLVATSIVLNRGYKFGVVIRQMKVGTLFDFLIAFAAWGVLAAMATALYQRIGSWAVIGFLGPVLMSRQVLARSQMVVDNDEAHRLTETALTLLTKQVDNERREERRLVAADLHDDVMQPLFKVTLMAQVLRQDLSTGRLLDLERDLPELVTASDLAVDRVRGIIGDLRQSDLGRGGIAPALSRLVNVVAAQHQTTCHAEIGSVQADSVTQLVLYQIAKEALNNAVIHSGADEIAVTLGDDLELIQLAVRDNGRGFDPFLVREGHYGLLVMKERAASIGASFFVDSAPNEGCVVCVVVPKKPTRD